MDEEGEAYEDDALNPSRLFEGYEHLGEMTEMEGQFLNEFDPERPTPMEEYENRPLPDDYYDDEDDEDDEDDGDSDDDDGADTSSDDGGGG